jgi:uncharacterized protein YcaQ
LSKETITISAQDARRLAVTKQHLAGKLPAKATREHILSVVRDLIFIQWDPIEVVAPSHVLALWNRVGNFPLSDLDRLLWNEKKLCKHWANRAALIVLTEDYSIYYSLMKRYPGSLSKSWGAQKAHARKFLAEHRALAKSITKQLKKGPLHLTQFEEYLRTKRSADAWTSGSDVSEMLFHLELGGAVMVVGHQGNRNVWGLPEEFLPSWVERKELTEEDVERTAAQRAIRALGTASPPEINYYFPRGRYQNLRRALESLEDDSVIHRVRVAEYQGREERYIHEMDIRLLEMMNDAWQPRVSLLPPFDNLICGRSRTNRVFGFDYSHEMFLPQNQRKFGYYVLPILWGDKLIGRVDPLMDRSKERLVINSVHAEPTASADKEAAPKIAEAIQRLADFLGAKEVKYSSHVPAAWRSSLR